jgi:glycosyltransferase involved in cell wall biosynthesis
VRHTKVSVLIPTYNRRRFVVEAVASVIAQDYEGLEIIVVDDGSTDDTVAALEKFGPAIRIIRTANQGPALARNTGMQAARGDYVAWLDSDDLYYPFKIRLQADLLDRFADIGVTYSDFSAFSDDGFWDECHLRKYHASAYQRGGLDLERTFETRQRLHDVERAGGAVPLVPEKWHDRSIYFGDIFEAYLFDTFVFTNSLMFRRSLLDQTGLQRRGYGMFHDLEFALRLLRISRAAFVDVPTYKLRYHPGQISTTQSPKGGKIAIRIQRDLLRVFRHYVRQDRVWRGASAERTRRQMARLCRAVAIPLLSYDRGTVHESTYYPARARRYLATCRECGYGEPVLDALTYAPHLARRLAFKLMSLRRNLGSNRAESD